MSTIRRQNCSARCFHLTAEVMWEPGWIIDTLEYSYQLCVGLHCSQTIFRESRDLFVANLIMRDTSPTEFGAGIYRTLSSSSFWAHFLAILRDSDTILQLDGHDLHSNLTHRTRHFIPCAPPRIMGSVFHIGLPEMGELCLRIYGTAQPRPREAITQLHQRKVCFLKQQKVVVFD